MIMPQAIPLAKVKPTTRAADLSVDRISIITPSRQADDYLPKSIPAKDLTSS
jgi:hypothetical protein